jgi:hypothetical protein
LYYRCQEKSQIGQIKNLVLTLGVAIRDLRFTKKEGASCGAAYGRILTSRALADFDAARDQQGRIVKLRSRQPDLPE